LRLDVATFGSRSPMSAVWKIGRLLPVYPNDPTTEDAARTSHSGQIRTWRIAKIVCHGSWLCENARTLGGDRTSYSLKTVFAVNRASALNLENELKNAILAEFRSFAFSNSQGQNAKNSA
jgi:hypothetical protein